MAPRSGSAFFRGVLEAAAIAVLSGCGGESPTTPRNDATPSFENIWPASAGNHWTYELAAYSVVLPETLFATAAEVPAVPDMEWLYSALMTPLDGRPASEGRGTYHLRFVEDVSPNAETVAMRLSKETQFVAGEPAAPMSLSRGSMWLRFLTQIRYYGSGTFDWVHLNESLEPGYEFTEPVPFFGEDSSLTTRVWRTRPYAALGMTYSHCIECFYVLDIGVVPVGTAYETIGYFRPFAYGVIVYAPDVGPVYCHERILYGISTWHDRQATLSGFANDAVPPLMRGM